MDKKNYIFLVGFMGSGKTTLGKALSSKLNFEFLDTDERIVQLEKRSIEEIFEKDGEDYFRSLELKVLKELYFSTENVVISTGGGFPCFNDNMERMLELGFVVFLDVETTILYNRLKKDHKRPLLKSSDDLMLFIETTLSKREPIYKKSHIFINGSELPTVIVQQISDGWKNF